MSPSTKTTFRSEPGSPALGPIVWGDGPMERGTPMIVGEAPGPDEIRHHPPRAFVGKSGSELWRYFDGDRIPERDHFYVTNVGKQLPIKKTPNAAEIAYWLPTLLDEIAVVDPKLIIALGATAIHAVLDPAASVERVHGIPHAWRGRIFLPCYHPAATLHSPELQSLFAFDMDALATGLRKGFKPRVVDPPPIQYERLPLDAQIPREFSIDTEGWPDEPFCLTISWMPGTAFYVLAGDTARLAIVRAALSRARRVTCHSLLADLGVLAAMDLHLPDAALDDTMVRAYNLGLEPQGLKDLAYRWLGAKQDDYAEIVANAEEDMTAGYVDVLRLSHDNPRVVKACERVLAKIGKDVPAKKLWRQSKFSKVVPPPPRVSFDNVPFPIVKTYACRDADLTERLQPVLQKQIEDRGLDPVYRLDMAVIPIVNRMQHVGMRVDPWHFRALIERFDKAFIDKHDEISRFVGRDVNPNSAPQVSRLLYGQLHLPRPRKRTVHGFSTEDKYLEAMRGAHPVMPPLIDARELTKLRSAYAAAILESAQEIVNGGGGAYWCIFPHLRITRVVSGRVSAFDPNVLAIPKHSELGRLIRMGFHAGPGRVLLSIDLNQIELRVAAHECRDKGMMRVFQEGRDLHAALGERIFGVKPALQEESKHRLPMKKANFGYWMGISAAGMRDQLHAAGAAGWSESDCQKILDEMDLAWPGASAYKGEKIAQARRLGYVTDFLGRRRYLAGVHSPDARIRSEAERQAHATPIQAGAQEVFKTWMSTAWREVHRKERPRYLEPWLQVHDDFINEVDEREANRVELAIVACIPQMLRVPVSAKAKQARVWGELC